MFCKNCGAQLEENASFCGNCGTRIEKRSRDAGAEKRNPVPVTEPDYVSEEPRGSQVKKKKKTGLIIGIAAVLAVLIAGGIFAYINYFSPEAQYDKYLELGQKYLLEENYEQAIVAFGKAIDFEPKSVDARLGISEAYINLKDYEAAVKYLEEVIDIDDQCLEAYVEAGKAYSELEDYEKAENRFNQALELDDSNMDVYDTLIGMYQKTQDEDKLKETLEKCVEATGDTEKSEQLDELNREFTVENMFRKEDEIPEEFVLDATIPKIGDKAPNADKINDQIASDYQEIINANQSDYAGLVSGFAYPTLEVKYEVHEFDGVYEIAIKESAYSTYGSGSFDYVNRYYYDTNIWDAITEDEFLSKVGLTKDSIAAAFNNECVEAGDPTRLSYEQIQNVYILDDNKKPVFYSNLYD